MSSSQSSAPSTSSYDPASTAVVPSTTNGVSSTLYLFTFLITILVLGLISGGLLCRAYYVRARWRRRVQEAMARGEPLPELQPETWGRPRPPKKEKKVGPRPSLWEAEMVRDGEVEKEEIRYYEKLHDWDEIVPVALNRSKLAEPIEPTPPPPPPPPPTISLRMHIRDLFSLSSTPPSATAAAAASAAQVENGLNPSRPGYARQETATSIKQTYTIPETGEDVVVGVLIALPVQGRAAERWAPEDPEEAEVPEVCLGIMDCHVDPIRSQKGQ